jgi:hypothetical protein
MTLWQRTEKQNTASARAEREIKRKKNGKKNTEQRGIVQEEECEIKIRAP